MTTIQPRNPVIGLIRLLALVWTLLSLLMFVGGLFALVYAAAWGCIGHHVGWFGCTVATGMIPFTGFASFVVALVVLFFAQLFYVAGAKGERVELRKPSLRRGVGGLIGDVITGIFD